MERQHYAQLIIVLAVLFCIFQVKVQEIGRSIYVDYLREVEKHVNGQRKLLKEEIRELKKFERERKAVERERMKAKKQKKMWFNLFF